MKPAPTGLIAWCDSAKQVPSMPGAADDEDGFSRKDAAVTGPGTPFKAAQPRSVVCPQMLHHSVVVLIPAGANAEMNVSNGTSPG